MELKDFVLRPVDLTLLAVMGISFLIFALDEKMGLGYLLFFLFGSLLLMSSNALNKQKEKKNGIK